MFSRYNSHHGIVASVANVTIEAFVLKNKMLISSSHFPSSTFIDLNDSFDEDMCLPVSSDMNISSPFLALVSNVYLEEDVPSNLNQVHGQSFVTVIDCLKGMSIASHSSNELRSLDYNKIKVEYVSSLPITINDTSSLNCYPFVFQLTIMDKCKAWTTSMMVMFGARRKPPTSIIILVWDLETPSVWGIYVAILIPMSISFALFSKTK